MKVIKVIVAILLSVIFSFITRYYMASINLEYVGEFTPVPHFIADTSLSNKLSLVLLMTVYLLIFFYLVNKKYFNFAISSVGVIASLMKYKSVTEEFFPVDMVFVPALLELAKVLCIFMAIGIVVQWIVDGGLSAVRLVNKNKK